jgi:tetratricopeptide (TPR) repeat protein
MSTASSQAPADAGLDPRMVGLPAEALPRMHAAARAIRDGAGARAQQLLGEVLAMAPEHPEALRLLGILFNSMGRHGDAEAVLQRALARRPDDAMILTDLGSAQNGGHRFEAACESWRRASELDPDAPMPWFNLGRNLQLRGSSKQAVAALQRATHLAPSLLPAHILLGDALVHLGRVDEAEERYRAALAVHPACGDAWRGLANIKTRPLSEDDRNAWRGLLARADIADSDRIAIGYALGKSCEDAGDFAQAFAMLSNANARLKAISPWDADAFRRHVDAVLAQTANLPAPVDPELGREAIFVVGLPRSGSTLFEQILAAHPQVEGASELPDLGDVLSEESSRRRQSFPQWLAAASAQDWHRLGEDYLQRTARWRAQRPRFTDKMPENWLFAGLLRTMLPGARVIDVRRDPVEAGWSCFKQQFYRLPHFSCDLADIGAYLRGCTRAMTRWQSQDPRRIRTQSYENLLADPEAQIRALLEFCALPFDPRCLAFHATERSVRTPSATQVRQPLRHDTARSKHYGALLDPLRAALAR